MASATIRSGALTMRSIPRGTRKMSPGPFAPSSRPSRKTTARSYSRSTRRLVQRRAIAPTPTGISSSSIGTSLERLDDHGDPLPAADARAAEAVARAAATQLVEQVDRDPRARSRERVRDRDRAAVHVRLLRIEPQLARDRGKLRSERLVHLDEVHVVERDPRLLEC